MALLRVTSQVEEIAKGDEQWKRNAEVGKGKGSRKG
jgi:hypothetical protein